MPGNFFEDFAPYMNPLGATQLPDGSGFATADIPTVSDNVMQMLDGAGPVGMGGSPADIANMITGGRAPDASPSHGRRSLLDIIGRASDVLAKVGGAEALYQPTLDARADRQMAIEDRARGIDLDALKKKIDEQQLTAGQDTLATNERARIATALAGVANEKDPASLWPQVAEQAGIEPGKAAVIGHILSTNPAAASTLASSLGYAPPQASKEVQNYRLLASQDPDAAKAYLKYIANPNELTPYEQLTLKNADRDFGLKLYEFQNPPPTAAERTQGLKDQKALADQKSATANVMTLLDNVQSGFDNLRDLKALPGQGGDPAENAMGWLSRTELGQKAGEQMGSPAAQKRLEIAKNISQLQQAMLKSLPASATRTRFEQEMLARGLPDPTKMDYNTARTVIAQLRQSFNDAMANAQAETASTPEGMPSRTILPKLPRGNGASSAGWGKAKVVG